MFCHETLRNACSGCRPREWGWWQRGQSTDCEHGCVWQRCPVGLAEGCQRRRLTMYWRCQQLRSRHQECGQQTCRTWRPAHIGDKWRHWMHNIFRMDPADVRMTQQLVSSAGECPISWTRWHTLPRWWLTPPSRCWRCASHGICRCQKHWAA